MNGASCPPGQKKKRPASGDKYMKQYAQAQALKRRSERRVPQGAA